jgi:hypothetical protein
MTLLDTRKIVSHRARKRARKQFLKTRQTSAPPPVKHKSSADPIPAVEHEKRDLNRIERQQLAALRMCERLKMPKTLKYLDYRFWHFRACFGDEIAENEMAMRWWCKLHWLIREQIRKMTRLMRGSLNPSKSLRHDKIHPCLPSESR